MELLALVLPLIENHPSPVFNNVYNLYEREFSTKSHELPTLAGLLSLSFGLELPRV